MNEMPSNTDVVIIGGGIVGCWTALHLARDGVKCVVLEKDAVVGSEQSSRSWGYIRQQGRDNAELPMMIDARREWLKFQEQSGFDIELRQQGNLRLFDDDKAAQWYRDWATRARELGLEGGEISQEEVDKLLPGNTVQWAGATYTPSDCQANPELAVKSVAEAAKNLGAEIFTGVTANAILTRSGNVCGVATEKRIIRTARVVVASGTWSRRLLAPLGLSLPVQLIRLTVGETEPIPSLPQFPASWSPNVAFRTTAGNSVLFANSSRMFADIMPSALISVKHFLPTLRANWGMFRLGIGGAAFYYDSRNLLCSRHAFSSWEPHRSYASLRSALRHLGSIIPETRTSRIARAWAGYIDGTPDSLPVIDVVNNIPGLVIGTGFSGHGFGLSPASGRALADLVQSGACNRYDLNDFCHTRFEQTGALEAGKKVGY